MSDDFDETTQVERYDKNPNRMKGTEKPYREESTLRELYTDRQMSLTEIAEELECGVTTVREWMGRHGIERRDKLQAAADANRVPRANYRMSSDGYMKWQTGGREVKVHRLLAVAEYGIDAVARSHVHHENRLKWDNRPANLTILPASEHMRHHNPRELTWLDEIRVRELHRNGDCSHSTLAGQFGVSRSLITNVINGAGTSLFAEVARDE